MTRRAGGSWRTSESTSGGCARACLRRRIRRNCDRGIVLRVTLAARGRRSPGRDPGPQRRPPRERLSGRNPDRNGSRSRRASASQASKNRDLEIAPTRKNRDLSGPRGHRREPALRRFDWPPAVTIPGADDRSAADRALRAFVGGELADHGCTLLLLGAALAGRLGEPRQAGERLLIPDLAEFGRDAAEKRRVWAALSRYRRAGGGGRGVGPGGEAGLPSGTVPESGAP